MNRLPEDFFGKEPEPKPPAKEVYLNSRPPVATTWEASLAKQKNELFKKFLEDNYPDKVFTPEEIKRMAHIELPDSSANGCEEIVVFQGRPILHFKWSNKKKTLEVVEL